MVLEDGDPVPNKALPRKNKTEDMQIHVPPKEINILLLGESGVEKSTFINSFANYVKHEHFKAAEQSNLTVLIPAKFTMFDKEFKQHVIEVGVNEGCLDMETKTYVFNITLENKPYLIRLVDTPGMGDPRGTAQDNKNCDYILNYLSRFKKVHAICLFLKPTSTRLDVFLNDCIIQILFRLEKSATQNICFLFTNTRGQNYTPGDAYTELELLVKNIKDMSNVTIPLSHDNVFCFDNEAFRFLASIKRNVQFKEGILEANIQSWKYSYKEICRLLCYIVQLNPHDVQKSVSINHARKMVLQLTQPLAEIVLLIGENMCTLDQHLSQLSMDCTTLGELKHKLHNMPKTNNKAEEFNSTLCKRSRIYKILQQKKELEKEHKKFVKCFAAFAHFLQKIAITPADDSWNEYVRYLIGRVENFGSDANKATLDHLKKLLTVYEQERKVLNEASEHDEFSSIAVNLPKMIVEKVEELFTLKHFGKKIKTTYDLHQSGDLREHKQSEFVVKESYHLSLVSKTFRK